MAKIIIEIDGEKHEGEMGKESILDYGENAGLDLPYSCKGGICSTCMAKLVQGEVTMDNNMVLTESEVKEGFVLTCQSHPTTDIVEVNYDI